MDDTSKTKEQLIAELADIRQRIAKLETAEAERKQAEKELQACERRYHLVAENTRDVIWTADMDLRMTYVSPSVTRVRGYSVGEAMALTPIEVFAPISLVAIMKVLAEESATEEQEESQGLSRSRTLELEINRKDGSTYWSETRLTFLRDDDGQPVGILGTDRDVTARRQAEEKLRQEHELLDTLMNHCQDRITFKDRQCRITRVNPNVGQTLQLDEASHIIGKTDIDLFGERFGRKTMASELRIMATGEPLIDVIERRQLPDGRINWTSSTKVPLRNAEGQITGIVEIAREINERKQAEEALRRHAAELEARNEELDAFAHTVAHDIQHPLSLVVGFAETVEADYAALSGEEVRHYLRTIARHGRKMSNIVSGLLLLSTVRKAEMETGPLDMERIVDSARQRLAHRIAEHHAQITLPETWPEATGYAPWVEEVWVNYLSNAIKYGGRPARVEIGAAVSDEAGVVRFWVRDSGPGVSPEDQERLFTPFTRLDQPRAGRPAGHGLGLSIVRRIVEKLGGQVGVESEIGAGSVFWFTLPISP